MSQVTGLRWAVPPYTPLPFGGVFSACWAETPITIARMTLTIKLDGNWNSFQIANNTPPLRATDSAIAPFRKDGL